LSVQVVASPTIIIQMTLEVSCMLLENIYGTSITHADRHLQLSYDTYRIVSTSCGITYDRHSDDYRGVIYAPSYSTFIVQASLMMIVMMIVATIVIYL
jgi:hypothetical protein